MSIHDYLAFHMTSGFDREWADLGFGDEELSELQTLIASSPEAGKVISGANGLRKIRFARRGQGKSGGVRVCYAYFPGVGIVLLATVFAKNEKSDLAADDVKSYAELIARYQRVFLGGSP